METIGASGVGDTELLARCGIPIFVKGNCLIRAAPLIVLSGLAYSALPLPKPEEIVNLSITG